MQTNLGVEHTDGYRICGHMGCRVWMIDDARAWCAVCEAARQPHVNARGEWVDGEEP